MVPLEPLLLYELQSSSWRCSHRFDFLQGNCKVCVFGFCAICRHLAEELANSPREYPMNARNYAVMVLLLASTGISVSQVNYKTISGYVRTSAGAGISGVTMGGFPYSTTTDSVGYYSAMVPYYVFGSGTLYWSGTVIPSKTGYNFLPDSIVYSSVSSNLTNQNYTGSLKTYTLSGFVLTGVGSAIGNVSMGGLPGTPLTDGKGYYYAMVTYGWSGTVTPAKAGATFNPVSTNYKFVTAAQRTDYTGTVQTFIISGFVQDGGGAGIAGVTMSGLVGNPVTDARGYYSAAVDYGWGGAVTPTKTGYSFTASSTSYKMVLANIQTNYTAALQVFTISGYVRTAGGSGIAGVVMSGLPGNPTTDGVGYYSVGVNYGWSGSAAPSKAGYVIAPSGTSYSNVTFNQSTNYTATILSFVISGYVKTSALSPMAGVVMNGLPSSPVTNSIGYYSDTVGYGWQGTVTPTKSGYGFTPFSKSYLGVQSDQTNQNYVGAAQQGLTIAGYVRTLAGAPIGGVKMAGLPSSPSTDVSGFYSDVVSSGWQGTVTPTKAGYVFAPPSKGYNGVQSDQTDQNYTGTTQGYTISGYVRTATGAPVSNVELNGLPVTTISDGSGFYSCGISSGWSGTVTPVKGGYSFSPISIPYSSVMSDLSNQNYTGSLLQQYSITGHVRNVGGAPIMGVAMNGLPALTITDQNGFYSCGVSSGWSGTVTPSKSGYSFSPTSLAYSNVSSDQTADYLGSQTQQMFTISGYVRSSAGSPIGGVVFGGLPSSISTDESGFYSSTVIMGWTGTSTPAKGGYTFSPTSILYSNVTSNQTSQNFTGTFQQMFVISGYVRTALGGGIGSVVMNGLPTSPSTTPNGYYVDSVVSGWSGTVTPMKSGYNFSPTSVTYGNVVSTLIGDFIGESLTNVESSSGPVLDRFALLQNYPNPFNPTTTIAFNLSSSSHASLGIFNMYGQRVATLVEGWKVAGLYQVRWNAANAPSGIYFYRLQAAGLVETRRMFLIK
jgi:hypothetical protein